MNMTGEQNMKTNNLRKCAIVGCGNVGATIAYTLMGTGLFSEMVLIDIDKKRAEGEAADLCHGLPFLTPMEIIAGDYSDTAGCSLIIITAGANQKPGQTRLDLVRTNAMITKSIVNEISRYNTEAILLMVTNPVDILTYEALKYSGFPRERVIGSGTVLDTARLKQLIGSHLGVDSRNVHAFIIGEHGDSELPVWNSANVSGIDLDAFGEDPDVLHALFEQAKNSAYQIISAKGATYYAIALAVRKIVSAIVRDDDTILPVSTLMTGQYGLEDICLSIPCVVGKNGIHRVMEIPLSASEEKQLIESAKALRTVLDDLNAEILI